MRNAVGSTWVFSICLTFIIIFTAYLAISINYAKAFRIKNHIISYIEESEGYTLTHSTMKNNIEEYLYSEGYTATGRCEDSIEDVDGKKWSQIDTIDYSEEALTNSSLHNLCIYRMDASNESDLIHQKKAYYKVITFFKFELPVIGSMPGFKVSGESKLIYDFANS